MLHLAADPVPRLVMRAALSLLFGWAALHKLRDRQGFRAALQRYDVLPRRWLGPAAGLLMVVEAGTAAGLCLGDGAGAAAVAAGLLALYAGAIGLNLLRGRSDIDCGCALAARQQPLSAGLVLRNAGLAAAAVWCTQPVAARTLTPLDLLTIAASVITLVLLYAAVDGLLAQTARRSLPLRGHGMPRWNGRRQEHGHA